MISAVSWWPNYGIGESAVKKKVFFDFSSGRLLTCLPQVHCHYFFMSFRGCHRPSSQFRKQSTRADSEGKACFNCRCVNLCDVSKLCAGFATGVHRLTFVLQRVPYLVLSSYIDRAEKPYNVVMTVATSRFFRPTLQLTMAVGVVLAGFYFVNLVTVVNKKMEALFRTSNTRGEARLKRAATRKMNSVLLNAHLLHDHTRRKPTTSDPRQLETTTSISLSNGMVDQAMLNYVLQGDRVEEAAGFLWTWKRLWTGEFFDTDGIWLPSRLLVFQCAQMIMAILISAFMLIGVGIAADEAGKAQTTLPEDLPKWARE